MAIQTLTCKACGTTWTRIAIVGRPPLTCDNCTGQEFAPLPAPVEIPAPVEGPMRHKVFPDLLVVASTREAAMLVGPAGSGKTTAGRQLAEELGLSFHSESCNPHMTKWDLLGFMGPNGNYVPGIIRHSFQYGGVMLLDEIDASNPAVLVSLNMLAAVEIGETVTFPDGANVPRHEDFILIAGSNTWGDGASDEYVGREQLDKATLDRFAAMEWGYDEALERKLAGEDMRAWVSLVQSIRQIAKELDLDMLVTPRATIKGTRLLKAGLAQHKVEDMVIWKGASADVKRTVRQALAQRDRVAS